MKKMTMRYAVMMHRTLQEYEMEIILMCLMMKMLIELLWITHPFDQDKQELNEIYRVLKIVDMEIHLTDYI